jgi:hypothetical protein
MYNCVFRIRKYTMEAEQINAISSRLQDLKSRESELRRYL